MVFSPKLELRQGQSLVLTPQLQQAIKMLQLSSLDLAAYIDSELERNPLLARDADESDGDRAEPGATAGDNGADTAESEAGDADWVADSVAGATDSIAENVDAEPDAIYPDTAPAELANGHANGAGPQSQSGPLPSRGNGAGSGEPPGIESYLAQEPSLADHLGEQLALCQFTPEEMLIARAIIDQLDEAGYLGEPLDSIASRIGATDALADRVLRRLQEFDPAGLFARSLSECLAIQLRDCNRYDPAMAALVDNLDLLAKRDFSALRKLCRVDEDDLAEMVAEIRALNPKPGALFGHLAVQTLIPDIFVAERPDGSWGIQLNADALPRVLVNQSYYAEVARDARSDADKTFLTDCLQNANWLVKSLEQRARTILKVAAEIVRQQDGFLAYGVTHLRPLNLRTVADAVGVHESTVSRVTSNKYMATPRGIFELKYFFTSAIATTGEGEAVSAEAVRHRIREMIDAETAADVLSDDTIVQRLRHCGIDIARRTVAKYRESMGIPSSVQRRREKRSAFG